MRGCLSSETTEQIHMVVLDFRINIVNKKHIIIEISSSHQYLLAMRGRIHGLMVTNMGFEFRDRSSIPIVCLITDDGFRQVVYIVQ